MRRPKTYTLDDWHKALADKNEDMARTILETTADECGKPNSYCLTEVFCPECALGLLPVQSARGMAERILGRLFS